MSKYLDPANAEFWVLAGLVIFLAIVVFTGRKAIMSMLDAKANQVRTDLEEAARLRSEAETLLAQLRAERAEAERQSAQMISDAEAQARQMEIDARARLEEQIARRAALADRRIAIAEQQAAQDVKAAAADLAARAAESVLAARVAAGQPDPVLDRAIDQLAVKMA
jgi:F-type H+-transporting ATPase subunit b